MEAVEVFGAKGGAGCSTVAAMLAATLSECGRRVELRDDGRPGGAIAAAGLCGERLDEAHGGGAVAVLLPASHVTVGDAVVYDRGVVTEANQPRTCGLRVLVLTSCYLGLARLVASGADLSLFDAVIWHREPGRAIGRREIETVTGCTVSAIVDHDAGIARSVDAGLLVTRHGRRAGALGALLRDHLGATLEDAAPVLTEVERRHPPEPMPY